MPIMWCLGMDSYCTGILPGHRCDIVFCLSVPSGYATYGSANLPAHSEFGLSILTLRLFAALFVVTRLELP